MKYKVGDNIIIIDEFSSYSCIDDYRNRKNLKNEIGKIVNIDSNWRNSIFYDIEVINCPYKKECDYYQIDKFCAYYEKRVLEDNIKPLTSLKLKKLIKHGV